MMRFGLCALAVLGMAACSPGAIKVETDGGETVEINGRGGYTLQVVGSDSQQVYVVTSPDGRSAAAKVEGEVSSLLGSAEAQNLVATNQAALAAAEPAGEDVNISLPGFSLKVTENGPNGESGRVKMKAMGFDLDVDAKDSADGERAVVRIGGADAKSAREFIEGADGLSAETRAEMLRKVGL
ncbi:MAG: hypothetical protein SGJ23_12705 [Alphaproteobacteria bacterium]|nr:hypothetical protein [Alphaproteobacteria bacterium]